MKLTYFIKQSSEPIEIIPVAEYFNQNALTSSCGHTRLKQPFLIKWILLVYCLLSRTGIRCNTAQIKHCRGVLVSDANLSLHENPTWHCLSIKSRKWVSYICILQSSTDKYTPTVLHPLLAILLARCNPCSWWRYHLNFCKYRLTIYFIASANMNTEKEKSEQVDHFYLARYRPHFRSKV